VTAGGRLETVRQSEGVSSAWRAFIGRWRIVAVIVIVCIAAAAAQHERAAKSYGATAGVTFASATLSDAALAVSPVAGEPQREADTEALIAHSPEVAEAVRTELHTSASIKELLSLVKVEAAPSADVLNIIASTGNPVYSVRLANAFAKQYINFKTQSQLAGINSAQAQLEKQISALPVNSGERATLEQSLPRLSALRAVAGGSATVIGLAALPAQRLGLTLSTTLVIGLLIGLAIAFSVVFLLETLDRRIGSIDDFEREYRLPALASVPQSAFDPKHANERSALLEPYRILRGAVNLAAVGRTIDTLLVTSAVAGEGKTTVAIDLAHAVALTDRRVVLIELDLRRPTFAQHFNLDARRGFTTAVTDPSRVMEFLVQPFSDLPNLLVLPSGRLPANPSELLGSPSTAEVLSRLAGEGVMTVIDAPPLNPVADTQELIGSPAVDAVLLVGRAGKTTRDEARRARAILDRNLVEPIGIVISGLRDARRYGYEAYEADTSAQEAGIAAPLRSDDAAASFVRQPPTV
jgi:capsular exopolysaccharide synthesis family protein